MTRIQFVGVDGSNPLGFMAALGLLHVVAGVKLGFVDDGTFTAFVDIYDKSASDIASLIARDAEAAASKNAPWRFTYTKAATKKQQAQEVADLKAPPHDFKPFLTNSIEAWLKGNTEAAGYAAAYGTDTAVDGKGNTKPTAFHFTAGQQTFLGAVEDIRASITQEWVEASLFKGYGERRGKNLRWDPGADRNWALMASDPSGDETRVNAPLEWLAFRGLPLLPSFPRSSRIVTTGVARRGDDMTFTWPLWSIPSSVQTTRSALQVDWSRSTQERMARGIFAQCSSTIRRSDKYGSFGPASVIS